MEYRDLLIYHGPISKQRCEELLAAKNKNGTFLIRDSETIHGALCLCVYKNNTVHTYRILQTHTGYYTLQTSAGVQEMFFKTMEELIQYYKKKNKGLITHLRHPVQRKELVHEDYVLPDEEPDYENVDSDYVAVLPD
ncbi:SH2 domain-containing protein 1B [Trichomycterus rosablanca]|uniref:SH2 domain-containing protein 1B n=1 Tax=Trichomycterus rosablanca TaxID=2290929 RepID=UPI002F358137